MAGNLVDACRDVEQRAAQTLKWVTTQDWLLDIAINHVILGRAVFYSAILQGYEISNLNSEIEQALSGLRRAGHQDELPKALLTRAWLRFVAGQQTGTESAQSDLEEAWEIAERGSMKLFMADIHLYRARLFGFSIGDCRLPIEERKYPWESPTADLAAAEKLINQCAYHRRDEELADAKAAMKKEPPQ